MTSRRIGILAEDGTDCETVEVLIQRLLGKDARIGISTRAGKGCSRLRGKAELYLRELANVGCSAAVLVHDLDQRAENDLRKQLQAISVPVDMRLLICIPVEELEAWFWSDPKLVKKITGDLGTATANPENIRSPKDKFDSLSRRLNHKSRYHPSMNKTLARDLDLNLCAQRCRAFRELRDFVGALGH